MSGACIVVVDAECSGAITTMHAPRITAVKLHPARKIPTMAAYRKRVPAFD
jgi:hypothetical protein